ncbi:hypothetical protein Pfo_006918 [Paulownia fortunei]|nr:hypothetical protein Pfo_006918 [Paulownia fortunei]
MPITCRQTIAYFYRDRDWIEQEEFVLLRKLINAMHSVQLWGSHALASLFERTVEDLTKQFHKDFNDHKSEEKSKQNKDEVLEFDFYMNLPGVRYELLRNKVSDTLEQRMFRTYGLRWYTYYVIFFKYEAATELELESQVGECVATRIVVPDYSTDQSEEEKLAMAYMIKGKYEYDALKCLFQEVNNLISGDEDIEVIDISSDHGGDDGTDHEIDLVAGIKNGDENTDNFFWNESTWYNSDNPSEASFAEVDHFTVMSSISEPHIFEKKKQYNKVGWVTYCPYKSPSSSIALNSPFKKT